MYCQTRLLWHFMRNVWGDIAYKGSDYMKSRFICSFRSRKKLGWYMALSVLFDTRGGITRLFWKMSYSFSAIFNIFKYQLSFHEYLKFSGEYPMFKIEPGSLSFINLVCTVGYCRNTDKSWIILPWWPSWIRVKTFWTHYSYHNDQEIVKTCHFNTLYMDSFFYFSEFHKPGISHLEYINNYSD